MSALRFCGCLQYGLLFLARKSKCPCSVLKHSINTICPFSQRENECKTIYIWQKYSITKLNIYFTIPHLPRMRNFKKNLRNLLYIHFSMFFFIIEGEKGRPVCLWHLSPHCIRQCQGRLCKSPSLPDSSCLPNCLIGKYCQALLFSGKFSAQRLWKPLMICSPAVLSNMAGANENLPGPSSASLQAGCLCCLCKLLPCLKTLRLPDLSLPGKNQSRQPQGCPCLQARDARMQDQ